MPNAESPVLTASPTDAAALRRRLREHPLLVVGLCATWCNTCGAFFDDFRGLAASRPDATFVWLDIEDDADIVGDIEVDNFPTIAVYVDGRPLHFGVSLPQIGLVRRLLYALDGRSGTIATVDAVTTLPARLALAADRAPAARATG